MSSDPVIERAKKLRNSLLDTAKEFDYIAVTANAKGNVLKFELAQMDAKVCRDAAEMLEKLGLEVDRLRQGIGCNYYTGSPDRNRLYRMTQNWNGDK